MAAGERHIDIRPRHEREGYTENTLFKVYDALRASGLTEQQARDAITDMQNAGILFRERLPEIIPTGLVPR